MQEKKSNTEIAFFTLVRAGLWEKEVRLVPYGDIDFAEVFRLAEEQSLLQPIETQTITRPLMRKK